MLGSRRDNSIENNKYRATQRINLSITNKNETIELLQI